VKRDKNPHRKDQKQGFLRAKTRRKPHNGRHGDQNQRQKPGTTRQTLPLSRKKYPNGRHGDRFRSNHL
jgi:hypothetical protein